MAQVVVLGGGISGHTCASFLRRWLSSKHNVVVVEPKAQYNWIPSNIWVGVGKMPSSKVVFDVAPVYRRTKIEFVQGRATTIYPEGTEDHETPYIEVQLVEEGKSGEIQRVPYDYLVNATGPKLNFHATTGLGPEQGNSVSVCTPDHATEAAERLFESIERMKRGEKQKLVIGTGHGKCTCQGAAFEYIVNLEFELKRHGVRDKAELYWLSNEYELGDFGMGGMHLKRGGYVTHSKVFTESLFAERGIHWITRSHVNEVQKNTLQYETLENTKDELGFDFAMLLPPFTGVGLTARGKDGTDITSELFAANGFMKVDADYTQRPFEEWSAEDWPSTYQNPSYRNIFAIGIAFAPPHAISRPMQNDNGTVIAPAPPRHRNALCDDRKSRRTKHLRHD
jgi:sulfide:quinone oxidoreductase